MALRPPVNLHISNHVSSCTKAFENVYHGIRLTTGALLDTLDPLRVRDEYGRFKVWSGNIAAHHTGRRSLEYRLRDASHIREQVVVLLVDLQETLESMLEIFNGTRVPREDLSDISDSDVSDSDDELPPFDSQPRRDVSQANEKPELQDLLLDTANIITCLLRLSMAIRNPAPSDQIVESDTLATSFYEKHDIQHVRDKFQNAKDYLVTRLGKANSRRRQYFTYRKDHHDKLAQGIELYSTETDDIQSEEVQTCEGDVQSTVASTLPSALKSTTAQLCLDDDACSDGGRSQTTFGTSATEDPNTFEHKLRCPPIPEEGQDGLPFECPFCFLIITVRSRSSWEKHVYSDLRPYVCSFEDCETPDRLFESRHQWFEHEIRFHGRVWQCIDGCGQSFPSSSAFQDHLRGAHTGLVDENHTAAFTKTCERKQASNGPVECMFCGITKSRKHAQKHIGRHHQQLALFVLPDLNDGQDEDQDEDSLDHNEEDHEAVSNESAEDEAEMSVKDGFNASTTLLVELSRVSSELTLARRYIYACTAASNSTLTNQLALELRNHLKDIGIHETATRCELTSAANDIICKHEKEGRDEMSQKLIDESRNASIAQLAEMLPSGSHPRLSGGREQAIALCVSEMHDRSEMSRLEKLATDQGLTEDQKAHLTKLQKWNLEEFEPRQQEFEKRMNSRK
ncbi:hypothetical protein BU16DRAFT_564083 [Lophium mytilinum]|uniref:C2H2-type domain-containing protein n=1 Tax=Lophium mytilinum TaxID=390894 RepID=A0A6A6QPD0_9PEZI|nr:hypothetical protein BU16DRAFT_564083 [Lophium mytilinum]